MAAAFSAGSLAAMAAVWLDLWAMRVWHTCAAFAMATFVFFWTGRHILRMALGAARRGITNQHVLLTAGALGGYVAGILGTPVPAWGWWGLEGFPPVDFFGVVMFLTNYHLLSGYVSLWVRTRASQSVRKSTGAVADAGERVAEYYDSTPSCRLPRVLVLCYRRGPTISEAAIRGRLGTRSRGASPPS